MTIQLKVKPGSKVDSLFYDAAGLLQVKIKAPAQDGKANAYLVEFLARQLGIPKASVTITAGFTSQHKRVDIDASAETVARFTDQIARP
ncbi:DUF167 domain-containing protein [Spirosoma sordidisoli]|uniref:UPF0235 protein EQG79_20240 n=1 Tax=Spirosoma sordidisoli TaxID=2502893 RepID=A0A4Q2UMC4_9BACT|nr:DUF167 domain-containing protein [Spirosoma sordidisoli]RYC68675.1 DUF167 domain-containing protein [Spirosoma sordidisoli]